MLKKILDTNEMEDSKLSGTTNIKCFYSDTSPHFNKIVIQDVFNERKAVLPVDLLPKIQKEVDKIENKKEKKEYMEKIWNRLEYNENNK